MVDDKRSVDSEIEIDGPFAFLYCFFWSKSLKNLPKCLEEADNLCIFAQSKKLMCFLRNAKTNRDDKKESTFAYKLDDWIGFGASAFGVSVCHALF